MDGQKILVVGDYSCLERRLMHLVSWGHLSPSVLTYSQHPEFADIKDKIRGYSVDTIFVDEFCKEETNEQLTNPYFKKESWRKSK